MPMPAFELTQLSVVPTGYFLIIVLGLPRVYLDTNYVRANLLEA